MELKNIEGLVNQLSEKVEGLIAERDRLKRENEQLWQEMNQAAEASADLDRSGSEIEAKLQSLNDRLASLVQEQEQQQG